MHKKSVYVHVCDSSKSWKRNFFSTRVMPRRTRKKKHDSLESEKHNVDPWCRCAAKTDDKRQTSSCQTILFLRYEHFGVPEKWTHEGNVHDESFRQGVKNSLPIDTIDVRGFYEIVLAASFGLVFAARADFKLGGHFELQGVYPFRCVSSALLVQLERT